MLLGEIADFLGGEICCGRKDIEITGISTIDSAEKSDITFFSNPRYKKYLSGSRAGAIITGRNVDIRDKTLLKVDDPYLAFALVLEKYFTKSLKPKGMDQSVIVPDSSKIGRNVTINKGSVICDNVIIGDNSYIYGNVYIGDNVKIGDNCIIYPGVVIREDSILGNGVILQPGVVIGGDGFGFVPQPGKHKKIPQIGKVIVGDDVEIGANSTVDRGAVGDTVIGEGTKIDNLVQIGHNVKIGKGCLIVSQVGIAGSAKIGDFVMIGGQAGIAGHIEIGDFVQIAAKTGVANSVESGKIISGIPAMEHKKWLKVVGLTAKLPDLLKRIRKLEKDG